MKITRSQKDAVISLLKEKFNEKQKIENEAFYKKNKKEIDKAISEFKADEEKVEKLLFEAKALIDKWKDSKVIRTNISPCSNWYYTNGKCMLYKKDEIVVNYPEINCPDFCKVERQLELDTLSKDFDLDKFIQKYLEN